MNKELFKMENKELTIKSIELVEIINDFRKLENGKAELKHSDFMKKVRKELEVLQSVGLGGQGNISSAKYLDEQGKERECFELTRDGMLQMLNSESTLVRYKTIEYINKLEEQIQVPQINKEQQLVLSIYNGGIEAVEAVKELTQLKVTEAITPLNEKIEQDKPLVEFVNTITESSDSIDVGQFAKLIKDEGIKLGRNKLFDWLRNNKYLMKDSTAPYQKYIDNGIFETKELTYKTPYGIKLVIKTLIKPKGQVYLVEKLRKEAC
jgi:phage antirepressor YoqD-like protein